MLEPYRNHVGRRRILAIAGGACYNPVTSQGRWRRVIATYCLNPCLDKTVEVRSLKKGGLNRIASSRTDPGGKGINVARALKTLDVETCAVCALPEKGSEEFLSLLSEEKLSVDSVSTPGVIRTNLKVHALEDGEITELNESGVPLSSHATEVIWEKVRMYRTQAEMHVLSGSLPPKASPATYYNLISELASAPVFLDASGEALLEGIKAKPMFVKPNRLEMEYVAGRELSRLEDIRSAAEKWVALGIRYVCVSLGSEGAMLATDAGCWYAPAMEVEANSTVGAGDAMVAGLILGWKKSEKAEDILRYGVAAASASCLTTGTQMLRKADFDAFLQHCEVRCL